MAGQVMDGIWHLLNMSGIALRHLEQEVAVLRARVAQLEAEAKGGDSPAT